MRHFIDEDGELWGLDDQAGDEWIKDDWTPITDAQYQEILNERSQLDLKAKRDQAQLSRTVFCQKLWRMNILPQDEAVAAARGEWPASFMSFAAGLSADAAADAQIEWAGVTEIRYRAPLLQALALSHEGGDQAAATALLDQIFEIEK